jgi:hypothetical protein
MVKKRKKIRKKKNDILKEIIIGIYNIKSELDKIKYTISELCKIVKIIAEGSTDRITCNCGGTVFMEIRNELKDRIVKKGNCLNCGRNYTKEILIK